MTIMRLNFSKRLVRHGISVAVILSAGLLAAPGSTPGQALPPLPKPINLKSAPVTVYPLVDGHSLVTWDTLAHFPYDAPDIDEEIDPKLRLKKKKHPIPGFIKKLAGEKIAVVGFMIPLETDDKEERATSFILNRSQASCCYGIIPKMNEWMFVQMEKGKTAEAIMDVPVTVFGTLDVGEKKEVDQGWSLYRMVSDKVNVPELIKW